MDQNFITARSPVRISFFGGGTDYPEWIKSHGGIVVGTAITKYSFVVARTLPRFFDYNNRLVYSKIETTTTTNEVEHRAIRACMQHLNVDGVEVIHAADLPSKSGTGSSSSFVVSLLNALAKIKRRTLSQEELYRSALRVEQEMMGECVGCQDQHFAAFGGVRETIFNTDGTHTSTLVDVDEQEFLRWSLLFYTKMERTASNVASKYVPSLCDKEKLLLPMMQMAKEGAKELRSNNFEAVGKLLDESWNLKKQIDHSITNSEINLLLYTAKQYGAIGGKLMGAGAGGCIFLVAPPAAHAAIKEAFKHLIHIPFNIDYEGSIICR